MQKHRILMTINSDEESLPIYSENLTVVNDYEVNRVQSLGGGIVNFSNVRGFLGSISNKDIAEDFFSYLSQNVNSIEFYEIYNSDQKLSEVFNNYYQNSVLNSIYPPYDIIEKNLLNTQAYTFRDQSIHNLDGVSPDKGLKNIPLSINNSTRKISDKTALDTFSNDASYYISVFIKVNHRQTDRERLFFDNLMQKINSVTPSYGGGSYEVVGSIAEDIGSVVGGTGSIAGGIGVESVSPTFNSDITINTDAGASKDSGTSSGS